MPGNVAEVAGGISFAVIVVMLLPIIFIFAIFLGLAIGQISAVLGWLTFFIILVGVPVGAFYYSGSLVAAGLSSK
jgi:hypothetical protein